MYCQGLYPLFETGFGIKVSTKAFMPKALKISEKSARPLLGVITSFERPNLKGRKVCFDIRKLRKDETFGFFSILLSAN
ncbi:MAG: hypothetical protein NZ530_07805 [Thermodesulfobacteriaceae bacterium]|nr:hypothetical protein [Thermodesulfobacteriaceae bacterium]